MRQKLYIVSTPIGNYDDITLRALKILKEVDFIVCEELKPARRLLAHYGIEKELITLNEHNEKDSAYEIIKEISNGKTAALISDCGTPLFSDPGNILVESCIRKQIEVIPSPGANSLLPALAGSGYDFKKFYYYGWLSPKKEIRRKELLKLRNIKEVIVILETPYRLKVLLTDVEKIFGKEQSIVVAFELTTEREKFFRGNISSIIKDISSNNLKGEFVLIVDNSPGILKNKRRKKK